MNGWKAGLDDFTVLPIPRFSSFVKSFVHSSFWQMVFECSLCPGHLAVSVEQPKAASALMKNTVYRWREAAVKWSHKQSYLCSVTLAFLVIVYLTRGGHLLWTRPIRCSLLELIGNQSVTVDPLHRGIGNWGVGPLLPHSSRAEFWSYLLKNLHIHAFFPIFTIAHL